MSSYGRYEKRRLFALRKCGVGDQALELEITILSSDLEGQYSRVGFGICGYTEVQRRIFSVPLYSCNPGTLTTRRCVLHPDPRVGGRPSAEFAGAPREVSKYWVRQLGESISRPWEKQKYPGVAIAIERALILGTQQDQLRGCIPEVFAEEVWQDWVQQLEQSRDSY